jgi:hypothetical protein
VTPDEVQFWKLAAKDLNLEIEAPFQFEFPSGAQIQASALVKYFGGPRGMVVDAAYSILEPHTTALIENGFGFSACGTPESYDRDDMIEVLADWEWSGPPDLKPGWLP